MDTWKNSHLSIHLSICTRQRLYRLYYGNVQLSWNHLDLDGNLRWGAKVNSICKITWKFVSAKSSACFHRKCWGIIRSACNCTFKQKQQQCKAQRYLKSKNHMIFQQKEPLVVQNVKIRVICIYFSWVFLSLSAAQPKEPVKYELVWDFCQCLKHPYSSSKQWNQLRTLIWPSLKTRDWPFKHCHCLLLHHLH